MQHTREDTRPICSFCHSHRKHHCIVVVFLDTFPLNEVILLSSLIIVFFLHKLSQSKDAFFKKKVTAGWYILCILISLHQGLARRRNISSYAYYVWLDISISCWLEANAKLAITRPTSNMILQNFHCRYYPDKEIIFWTIDGHTEEILCSIEVSPSYRIHEYWYWLPISCYVFPIM